MDWNKSQREKYYNKAKDATAYQKERSNPIRSCPCQPAQHSTIGLFGVLEPKPVTLEAVNFEDA
jgi:hypothetical protein